VLFKGRPSAFALTADGKRLVVLTAARRGDERRVPADKVPRKLTGLARKEYRQRNDGLVADLLVFEVPSGKLLREHPLWYTSGSDTARLLVAGDVTWVLNFANVCARISSKGEVTLFETDVLFNYAVGASPDAKVLAVGGEREGTYGAFPPGR